MRVCFDGLCFASRRPAVEEETQTVLCGATALDGQFISTSSSINNTKNYNIAANVSEPSSVIVYQQQLKQTEKWKMQNSNDNQSTEVMATDQNDFGNNNFNNMTMTTTNLKTNVILNQQVDNLGNLCINSENNMGLISKEQELVQLIQVKDQKIYELEEKLRRKNDEIAELRSHLDKFQSVFPFSHSPGTPGRKAGTTTGVQRQRAQGISAEPQSECNALDLLKVTFPKYDKEERLVTIFFNSVQNYFSQCIRKKNRIDSTTQIDSVISYTFVYIL